jgi:hypothetical protein
MSSQENASANRSTEILQKLAAHLNQATINAMLTKEEIGQVEQIWENTSLSYIEAFAIFLLEGHGYITLPAQDFEPWEDDDDYAEMMNWPLEPDDSEVNHDEILDSLEQEWKAEDDNNKFNGLP